MLYNTYSPPPGFCFDVLCADDPIIDDKRSPDYNIVTKASTPGTRSAYRAGEAASRPAGFLGTSPGALQELRPAERAAIV